MKIKLLFTLMVLLVVAGCGREQATVVARVGGTEISVLEYRRVLARKLRLSGAKQADDRVRSEVLNSLVDRRLLSLEAKARGLAVTEVELDAAVEEIRRKAGSSAAFLQALNLDGLNKRQFCGEIAETMLAEKIRGILADSVAVAEEEAYAYFGRNRKDFVVPAKFRVHLIPVAGKAEGRELARRIHNDETVLTAELSKITDPVLVRLNALQPLSAADQFSSEVADLLPQMKALEIGGPVRTKRGWFLVRLLEVRAPQEGTWEKAREQVLHLLYQEKKERAVAEWLSGQRKTVEIKLFPERLR